MATPAESFQRLCSAFDAGDTTIALANQIEGLVLEEFGDEPWADELVEVLSLYQPAGVRPYADEAELRQQLAVAQAALGLTDGPA